MLAYAQPAIEPANKIDTNTIVEKSKPATARLRLIHFQLRPKELSGRATVGSPSENRSRSSINSSALEYLEVGSLSRHLRQTADKSALRSAEIATSESKAIRGQVFGQQARIYALQGKSLDAIKRYELALKDLESSEEVSRTVVLQIKNGLANEYGRKDVDKAFELMELVVEEARKLSKDEKHAHLLGDSLNDFGVLHLRKKLWADAAEIFSEAKSLYEDALKQKTNSNKYREYLAGTIANLSWVTKEEEKLALRKQSFELFKSLVRDNPDIPRYQKNLIDCGQNLFIRLMEIEEVAEAKKVIEYCKPIAQRLCAQNPDVLEYSIVELGVLSAEMDYLFAESKLDAAREVGKSILERWKVACSQEPEDQNYRSLFVRAQMNLAEVYMGLSKRDLAIGLLNDAKSQAETISVPMFDKHRKKLSELLNEYEFESNSK